MTASHRHSMRDPQRPSVLRRALLRPSLLRPALLRRTSGICAAALLAAPLAVGAPAGGAQAASRDLTNCMDPGVTGQALAESCRRAGADASNSARERAAASVTLGYALSELGRDGDALTAYDEAARLDPGFSPIYLNRAISREKRGMVRGALQDFAEAIRLRPNDPAPRLGRGGFYLRRNMGLQALEDFETAARLDREDPAAQYNRGLALANLERWDDAERAFGLVLRLSPGDAGAYLERAKAKGAGGDLSGGLKDIAKASELRPDWADPWLERGLMLERLGDGDAALAAFRRAFELGAQQDWLRARVQRAGG